jgi:hypothetical protein
MDDLSYGSCDIEAQAKRRLADEYDAAQARREVARRGNITNTAHRNVPMPNVATPASFAALLMQRMHGL